MIFVCPHCGNQCIGWFAKFTTGVWGPVVCQICGGLSRESRWYRIAVSIVELGLLVGVAFLPKSLLVAGLILWGVVFAVAEWFFLQRIPLVAVSRTWERSKAILSWAIVIGLLAFFVTLTAIFS